ncbi:restriction endonuclease subunit S [Microbacterium petrolearium]
MSRIDDLVADLCPHGVALTALGQVGVFVRGNGLQKSDLREEGVPAIHYGQIHTHYGVWATEAKSFTEEVIAAKLRHAHPGDLLIATTSEDDAAVAKATAWLGATDVVVSGDAYIYRHELDPKYVSYFFQSTSFQDQKRRFISGTKVRRVSGDSLAKIQIPVPPLEIQREIVGVLDKFTQLEAELEAELEARRAQYEHYREDLLAFGDSVTKIALGDVIEELRTGLNPRQNFKLNPPGATNHYITVRELAGFTVRPTEKTDRVDDAGLARIQARSRLRAGDVLFSGTGTIGRTALVAEEPRDWNIKEGVYALTPKKDMIRSRFLIHLLRSGGIRTRILGVADGSTVASVSMASLRRVLVPVPTLEEQDRLISLLDNFESLTNDLTSGLPAELTARRKQYEFYRDRLLTFKELLA